TEGIVGREEEPRIAAGLHEGVAGAVGEGPGVVGPVNGVRRTCLAGQVRRPAGGVQVNLVLFLGDVVHRERDRGRRHVHDYVHTLDVVPLAGDIGANVRLVLVVGEDHLDLGRTLVLLAVVLDRLLGRPDGALAGQIGINA